MAQITVKLEDSTQEWLSDNYPDAINNQEAVRMAISDARLFRMASDFEEMPEKYKPAQE